MRTYQEHTESSRGKGHDWDGERAMNLLFAIERFLRRNHIPATRFGRDAVKDPRFVLDLRNGREPRPQTRERVLTFMADYDARKAA